MIFNFQTCKFCPLHLNNKKILKNLAQNSQRPLSPAQLNPLRYLQAFFFSQHRLRANERPDLIKSKTKKNQTQKTINNKIPFPSSSSSLSSPYSSSSSSSPWSSSPSSASSFSSPSSSSSSFSPSPSPLNANAIYNPFISSASSIAS